jgi:hypothetical protein
MMLVIMMQIYTAYHGSLTLFSISAIMMLIVRLYCFTDVTIVIGVVGSH